MNQGLIRFDSKDGANISDAVIASINASGEAFLSGGSWNGARVMRISVCGWNTNADDVEVGGVRGREALDRYGQL
jgi:aromatic-L-amino-acid decarboxylase